VRCSRTASIEKFGSVDDFPTRLTGVRHRDGWDDDARASEARAPFAAISAGCPFDRGDCGVLVVGVPVVVDPFEERGDAVEFDGLPVPEALLGANLLASSPFSMVTGWS
jgi:hypothetical protein